MSSKQSSRVTGLSAEERELLTFLLEEEGIELPQAQTIPVRENSDELPLSFAQQRLWFLDQLEPNSPFYNMPQAIRINGLLDTTALQQTLEAIVARHESLRTTFSNVNGSPIQVIAESSVVAMPVIDLSKLPESEREDEAQRLAREGAQRPFNLERGPLLRASLLRLSPDDHVLLLTMHHIIGDGWSMGVLFRELGKLYEAFSQGEASPLPDLPIQYADYAVWQREWLRGEVLEKQLAYWRKQLGGELPVLELPTDRPRPAMHSFSGARLSALLPKRLNERLVALSQAEGATLFMTLLAAFQILLGRYARQDDVIVGSPIAGRTQSRVEDLIGFFINTLVLRTDLSGNPTFREVLGRVKEVTLGAYEHQDLPFEKLVEELQPERDLGHNPLFQVFFALQNAPGQPLELPGLKLSSMGASSGTTPFDIGMAVVERAEGLQCVFGYNTDLFDAATISRMLSHFQVLLEGIVADPEQRISSLPLLTDAERHQLLVEWNATTTDYPRNQCIHQLFEAQVERAPAAAAVIFENQQLTYRELNKRANQLAHYLRKLGVGPDVLVGILMERSIGTVVGLLGILKAGGAYVALDPLYPQERLSFMLEDARVPVLLTQGRLAESLPQHEAQLVNVDEDWEAISKESAENPASGVTSNNLAYVIYTSGSTGKPKGVLISHRSLVNYIEAASDWFAVDVNDRVLQFASISFDTSAEEIYPCLTRGATLVLRNDLMLGSISEFFQKCREQALTVLDLPTAYWHEITARLEVEALMIPPSLRLVVIGGERALPERVAAWRKYVGDSVRLLNGYGPTEATIVATMCEITGTPGEDGVLREVPIGRPISNVQTYVLDSNIQPVPIGVPGELYIGGDGLARGYLNRPELTAEKFILHPFTEEPHARLYRSGDLVRYLPDGNLTYLGRVDHQVKIRGFRVELGEIEAVLNGHDAVQESVLVSTEDESGDKRLVAYVVPNPQYHGQDDQALGTEAPFERVSQWEAVFDDLYSEVNYDQKPKFYVKGWDSSYTGQPIPDEEVQEWMDHTVDRILSLKPSRVREIGCGGSGLMLFQIAPYCQEFCATDLSENAIEILRHQFQTLGQEIPGVTLLQRAADDFDDVAPDSYDALLIVSVAQYFPSIDYLLKVLERAVEAVQPGGFIFLGDMRSLPLLEAFHASVQLYRAASSLSSVELKTRIQKHFAAEKQLTVDPDFFRVIKERLPKISDVKIQLLRGRYHNELTKFRYDVILRIGSETHPDVTVPWINWQKEGLTLESVRRLLAERKPEIQGITGVPNDRVVGDLQIMKLLRSDNGVETAGALREAIRESEQAGVDPEDLWALSDELPYALDITWSDSAGGCYDVVFRRRTTEGESAGDAFSSIRRGRVEVKPLSEYANNPNRQVDARGVVSALRSHLREKLPEYMMPSAFVVLDALPLTPNGKVDRRALPLPGQSRPELEGSFVAPRTPLEELLVGIWSQVLRVERLGIYDNFFELGGHSLLATQVVSRIRIALQVEVPLRALFGAPTVAGLALAVEEVLMAEVEGLTEDEAYRLAD